MFLKFTVIETGQYMCVVLDFRIFKKRLPVLLETNSPL